MSDELSLYKLITEDDNSDVSEFGWENENEFLVFIYHFNIESFMEQLSNIFGYGIFDDDSFIAHVKRNYICINLCEVLDSYIDLAEVFPKDKYKH